MKVDKSAINQSNSVGKTGNWITIDSSNAVVVENYKLDKLTGGYVKYHTNGLVAISGTYKKGVKHGVWRYYDNKGHLWRETKFKNGVVKQNRIVNTSW